MKRLKQLYKNVNLSKDKKKRKGHLTAFHDLLWQVKERVEIAYKKGDLTDSQYQRHRRKIAALKLPK
jgi:hypothetical protein